MISHGLYKRISYQYVLFDSHIALNKLLKEQKRKSQEICPQFLMNCLQSVFIPYIAALSIKDFVI